MKQMYVSVFILLVACMLVVPSGFCKDRVLTAEEVQIANRTVHIPPALALMDAAKKSDIHFSPDAGNSDITQYITKAQRSLNLGRLIGQAAVSVITRDADSLNTLSGSIEALGKGFGVSDTIKEKREIIVNLIKNKEWDKVAQEMVLLETWVKKEIMSLRNSEAVVMANTAGMITGLFYTTKGLMENYSAEASKILRAPDLVADLIKDMNTLPPRLQKGVVKKVMDGLERIKPLVSIGKTESIPLENIKKLNQISSELITAIAQ